MVICINHFFSQPVSSPRDSLGNRLPELAGERFLVVHAWERNSLLPQKGFKSPKFSPKSIFSCFSRVPTKTQPCPTKTPSMKHRKKETKNPCHTILIREILIHLTEFILRISDEVFVRVLPFHVAVQGLHPGGELLHYRHPQASLWLGVLHEVGQGPGHISHLR